MRLGICGLVGLEVPRARMRAQRPAPGGGIELNDAERSIQIRGQASRLGEDRRGLPVIGRQAGQNGILTVRSFHAPMIPPSSV